MRRQPYLVLFTLNRLGGEERDEKAPGTRLGCGDPRERF